MSTPADRLRAAAIDLKAVGPGGVVRAGYELSKHGGGHRLLFGHLARSQGPVTRVTPPFGTPRLDTLSAATRDRARQQAEAVLRGEIELFGRTQTLGAPPDWHACIDRPGRWPADCWWWDIDIRSTARTSDVKWVWELGRHRSLVVLARAAFIERDDTRWADALAAQLTSWLDGNPPEQGVHWYSNLEIALRALAWLDILALAGPSLPPSVTDRMAATLHHTARHLLADLTYSLSSMRNNHLLGDALGLLALGRAFPDDRRARRWRAVGDHIFDAQIRRQFRMDGSVNEDSVSYHRFILEMLTTRVRIDLHEAMSATAAGRDRRSTLAAEAQFLARLGTLDGTVPHHGDGDEGRVLVAPGGADALEGSVLTALALAGSGASATDRERLDEVAWYAPPGTPVTAEPAERDGHAVGGGIARAARGDTLVWLKAGGGDWHGHADLCSVAIRHGDDWVVGDPGTGTYNGDDEQRTWFRTSIAHSVLRLAGEDQLVPYRAFRWQHRARGAVGPPVRDDNWLVMWGVHASYTRFEPPRRVARLVIVEHRPGAGPDEADSASDPLPCLMPRITVADVVEGPLGIEWSLSIPLGPGAVWDAGTVQLPNGPSVALRLPDAPTVHRGERDPFDGWWSDGYGAIAPSDRLDLAGTLTGPVYWEVGPMDPEPWHASERGLVRAGLEVRVGWHPSAVSLSVHEPGRASTVSVPIAVHHRSRT